MLYVKMLFFGCVSLSLGVCMRELVTACNDVVPGLLWNGVMCTALNVLMLDPSLVGKGVYRTLTADCEIACQHQPCHHAIALICLPCATLQLQSPWSNSDILYNWLGRPWCVPALHSALVNILLRARYLFNPISSTSPSH